MGRLLAWGLLFLLACGCGSGGPAKTNPDGNVGPILPKNGGKTDPGKAVPPVFDPSIVYLGKPLKAYYAELEGKDNQKKQDAIFNLAKYAGPEAKVVVPLLREALKDSDPYTRAGAARALARIAPEYPEAVKVLIEDGLLYRDNPYFAAEHKEPLRQHGKLAVPGLLPLLRDSRDEVKDLAVSLLGQIGPAAQEATPTLLELAKEAAATPERMKVRNAARVALGQIRADAKTVVPVLVEMAKADAGGEPKSAAFDALGGYAHEAGPARQFLSDGVKKESNPLPYALALLRGEPSNKEARGVLIRYLDSPTHRTLIIDELVFNGKTAVPDLLVAWQSNNREVRNGAGAALRRIDPEAAKNAGVPES